MQRTLKRALFIFRRDLRLEDNTGLLFALENAERVVCAFIFTPEQIDHNPYRSDHCLQFMLESLMDLSKSLQRKGGKLYLFFGKVEKVLVQCIKELKVEAIVVNRDYTPYSIERDRKIEKLCKELRVAFHSFDDLLLHPPEKTLKKEGKPYSIFTPFYRNASRLEVALPLKNEYTNYYSPPLSFAEGPAIFDHILPEWFEQAPGGRTSGLEILKHLKDYAHYQEERDFPALPGTTLLSAHLKFTTLSAREVYHAVQRTLGDSPLLRSLYWRDFFTSIALYFPYVFEGAFHPKFNNLPWDHRQKSFQRWCQGETGFPIVDAGMREMNQTGYMHNRVRMIAASLLVKDLHVDWRWGERYFAQTLIDYDPAVNNGNWQWVASTGCDSQPYFRLLNPWNQQIRFDPECLYIKHWVPEIKDLPPKTIHRWHRDHSREVAYPAPLCDHSVESKITLQNYKKASYISCLEK